MADIDARLREILGRQAGETLDALRPQIERDAVRTLGLIECAMRHYRDILAQISDPEDDAGAEVGGLLGLRRRRAATPSALMDTAAPVLEAQRVASLATAHRYGDERTRAWASGELARILPPADAPSTPPSDADFEEA